jgi:hypothetical protein
MNNFFYKNKTIFILFFFVSLFFYYINISASEQEASTGDSLCGNGVINLGEECDGLNLAGQTCVTRGFSGGVLTCNSTCIINSSQCVIPPPPPPPPGGGGGGGGTLSPTPETKVSLSGRAYPGMKVTILKDGQISAVTIADPGANFNISVSGLTAGNYTFGVYSEDGQGRRSALLTFPVVLTLGVTITVDNLFISPTIAVDKSEVKYGDNLAIFGQSTPNSEIIIAVNSAIEIFSKVSANAQGVYLYNFDTTQLEMGSHSAKSRASLGGAVSPFGLVVPFKVGDQNIIEEPSRCQRADLNCDGRVNLIDFSIAAYWYKRTLSDDFKKIERDRLNSDGKIDLVDFSILAYYWSG